MNEFILFKHPDLKFRKENFGGIVKTNGGLYIIDKRAFNIIHKINNKKTYSELTVDEQSKNIINELIRIGVILKINKKRADQIKKEINHKK
ncbi:MAG TPA: hypothetical protein VJ438_05685 [Candidatus Nanoarchaeia archaeon]|nr:hypothetical protein [Candidatus Nanoarchaeia archaeon]